MGKVIEIIKTEDCPCEGKHAWMWHKSRGMPPCEHARERKYGNYNRWQRKVREHRKRTRKTLSEDVTKVPWIAGMPIYVDEEEKAG